MKNKLLICILLILFVYLFVSMVPGMNGDDTQRDDNKTKEGHATETAEKRWTENSEYESVVTINPIEETKVDVVNENNSSESENFESMIETSDDSIVEFGFIETEEEIYTEENVENIDPENDLDFEIEL